MAQPQPNGADIKDLEKEKKTTTKKGIVERSPKLSLFRPSCFMVSANPDPRTIAGEGIDGAEKRIPTHLVVTVNGLVGRCVFPPFCFYASISFSIYVEHVLFCYYFSFIIEKLSVPDFQFSSHVHLI
jgi:hypothetical protein